MAIAVLCPGCKAQFQVSDKFAGKKGPCPKCKTVITIPEASPEIVIHAPESIGPKDSTGRPVFSPLLREETRFSQTTLVAIGAATATLLLVAFMLGRGTQGPPTIFLMLGIVGLAPPLSLAGYELLRDQESTPYRGRTLYIRAAACSAVFALLWAAYVWLPQLIGITTEGPPYSLPMLAYLVPVMVGLGALAAYVSFDLEFGQAIGLYGLYLAATVILSWIAGVNWMPAGM